MAKSSGRRWTLSGKELYIKAYLNSHRMTDFRDLLERQNSREEIIVAFLVVLELMKTGKIRVTQNEPPSGTSPLKPSATSLRRQEVLPEFSA